MYMREMGTVELLTREGEIAIAKRIEEGLNQMTLSLASFPWTVQLLLEDWELHKAGKKRLAEIVVGFNDGLDDEPEPPAATTAPAANRSEEHTSELQSLMRIAYAQFCLTKQQKNHKPITIDTNTI